MTNNITPIGSRKSAKNEKSEQPVTQPAPKPTSKPTKATRATKAPHIEPAAEPTQADDICEIDQAAIAPNVTRDDLERLSMNFTDIVDELPEGVSLPDTPEGYERCAECGLPTPVGGNGLCALHDVSLMPTEPTEPTEPTKPTENVEAQESVTTQPSETVEESAVAQREAKAFSPVQIRKLAREKIWAWSRKHNLPLTRSGAKDEGYTLATDEIGGTAGRVLIGYHAPEMEDIEKRRQFAAVQLNKVGLMLRADGVAIEMTTLDGEPTLVVPTTRVPGKPDEKKPTTRSNQAATKRWTIQLSGDEQEGSGI